MADRREIYSAESQDAREILGKHYQIGTRDRERANCVSETRVEIKREERCEWEG